MRIHTFVFGLMMIAACGGKKGPTEPDPGDQPKDPDPPVIIKFEAVPNPVTRGYDSKIGWEAKNAKTCYRSGTFPGWQGQADTTGEFVAQNVNERTRFVLGCSGEKGRIATRELTLDVTEPTLYISFRATPDSGDAPLQGVALVIKVDSGTARGPVTYRFKCQRQQDTLTAEYTTSELERKLATPCSYPDSGVYEAWGEVERQGVKANATSKITVTVAPPPNERARTDRPDDFEGKQAHCVYLLPKNGIDAKRDVSGNITNSLRALQGWLRDKAGINLRVDTYQGSEDCTFVVSNREEGDLKRFGSQLGEIIVPDLLAAGLNNRDKIYIVFYEGDNVGVCSWPFVGREVDGIILSLRAAAPLSGMPCSSYPLMEETEDGLWFWETRLLHQFCHVVECVDPRAPNHTTLGGHAGHVKDYPLDVMYYVDLDKVRPNVFDCGRDDYFSPNDLFGTDENGKSVKIRNVRDNPYFVKVADTPPQPICK